MISILDIVIFLSILGIVLWVVKSFIPMDSRFKELITLVILLFVIVWLLRITGIWHYLKHVFV